jgi:DHA1 family multidrug resistance protein-like MFS transporter
VIAGLLERTAIRDWRAVTALFFCSSMLEAFAMGHVNAFMPLLLGDELGLGPDEVRTWTGILTAITFAVAFPLAPFWGALAERYTRKLIIVRSMFVEALAYAMIAFAQDLTWLVIARLLLGLAFGNIAIIIATQSLLVPERRMASAISVVQATNPIAVSVGPPIGALLLPSMGLRNLLLMDAALILAAGVAVTLLMPEPPGRDTRRGVMAGMLGAAGVVWRQESMRWNFAAWFLTRGAMTVVDSYLPVRITELARPDPAPAIGWIMGVFGALTSVATAFTGRLIDRVGGARVIWPSALAACISVAGMAFAQELWLLAAFAWLRALPVGVSGTALYAQMALVLPRRHRATVMSFTPTPRNVAAFVLPVVAAGAAVFGTSAALLVAAAAYGAGVWVGKRLLDQTPIEAAQRQKEREAPA